MRRVGGTFFSTLMILSFLFFGCAGESDVPSGPGTSGTIVATGDVTQIDNLVPVDGGITIEINLEDGKTEHLLFASLFTAPPPSEERLKLYDVVRRVEVGDRIRAEGKRVPKGIELEALAILEGRP